MSETSEVKPVQTETPVPPAPAPKKEVTDLGKKWRAFGSLWIEPFNGCLLVTMVLMYLAGFTDLEGAAGVLAQTVLALASGVLGGRIANAVSVINSEAVLKARGTVAVRGLNLMLRNVRALDRRVDRFRCEAIDPLQAKNYEEIQEICRVLSEEGITSIENWTDIVPEAHQASVVGMLSKLQEAIDLLQAEKDALAVQLQAAVAAGVEVEGLKDQIATKDERIGALEKAYSEASSKIASYAPAPQIATRFDSSFWLKVIEDMRKTNAAARNSRLHISAKGTTRSESTDKDDAVDVEAKDPTIDNDVNK